MRVGAARKAGRKLWLALGILLLGASLLPAQAADTPVIGDWLISHLLSDPENLNPLTSNDAASSRILSDIFESLLTRHPQTLELRPHLAVARPQISDDKLMYTFTLRRDAYFQDGKPLTGHDVLFTLQAIKNPWVNAPFRRVYFQAPIVQAELLDDYTIRFIAKEPYFRNETILGGMVDVLPRHYYDPDGLLAPITIPRTSTPWRPLPWRGGSKHGGWWSGRNSLPNGSTKTSRVIPWGVALTSCGGLENWAGSRAGA